MTGSGRVLVAGLVLAVTILGAVGIRQATVPPAAARTALSGAVDQAWLDYRAGERGEIDPTTRAWLDYRAGERGDARTG